MNASLGIQISAFGAFHDYSRISQRSVYYHRNQYYCTQSGRRKKNSKRTTIISRQQNVWCVSLFFLCVSTVDSLFSVSRFVSHSRAQLSSGTLISLSTNKWYKKKRREKRQPKPLVYFTIIINSTFFSFFGSHSIRNSVEVLFYVVIIISWLFVMRGIFGYIS